MLPAARPATDRLSAATFETLWYPLSIAGSDSFRMALLDARSVVKVVIQSVGCGEVRTASYTG